MNKKLLVITEDEWERFCEEVQSNLPYNMWGLANPPKFMTPEEAGLVTAELAKKRQSSTGLVSAEFAYGAGPSEGPMSR